MRADHMVVDLAVQDSRLLVATQSGRVEVFALETGDPLPPVMIPAPTRASDSADAGGHFAPTIRSLSLSPSPSPSGQRLAVVSSDGRLLLFSLVDGAASPLHEWPVPALMVASYLADGRLLLGDMRGELALFDPETGREPYRRQLDYDPIYGLALSPDEARLAVISRSSRIQIVDPTDGRSLYELAGHRDSIFSVVWLSDHELASASKDKRVLAWDLHQAHPAPRTLHQSDQYVTALGFDPEHDVLAITLEEFEIGLLQRSGGSVEGRLTGHTAPIQRLVFVDGGRQLISAGYDAQIFVWQLDPGREHDSAEHESLSHRRKNQ